jgi:hypothetical protein
MSWYFDVSQPDLQHRSAGFFHNLSIFIRHATDPIRRLSVREQLTPSGHLK